MQANTTMALFAFRLGAMTQQLREGAAMISKAYHKAEPGEQSAIRRNWVIAHVAGQMYGAMDPSAAMLKVEKRFVEDGKVLKAEINATLPGAYDRASSDFRYYVVRTNKTTTGSKVDPTIRVIGQALKGANKRQIAEILSLLTDMGLIEME